MNEATPIARPTWSAMTTEEKVAFAKPLYLEQGIGATVIAGMFDPPVTRNQVLGILHRGGVTRKNNLGGPTRHHVRSVKVAEKPKPKPAPKPKNEPKSPMEVAKAAPPAVQTMTPWELLDENRDPLPGTIPVTLMQLPDRPGKMCRYPVKGGFCGVEIGKDDIYCQPHHDCTHTKPEVTENARRPRHAAK